MKKIEVILDNTNDALMVEDDDTEIIEIPENLTDNEIEEYLHKRYGVDGWWTYDFIG